MKLCEKEKCTGCRACENSCPKDAIKMVFTDELKTVPHIDSSKCAECGLCKKSCPVLNESKFVEPISCLAAWTLDSHDKETCASGGIATALYRSVLKHGGVVYGCDYDNELKPIIRRSENVNDLEKFKTSKYVQSSTERTYIEVKKDLTSGCTVLYVGTPCQIDGLNHFLNKKYENLFTVDIICHGVSPYRYLQDYILSLGLKKNVTYATFRGKNDYCLSLYEKNDLFWVRASEDDYYLNSFLKGITFRDNCYNCRYAGKERISDLTIGDFWGINRKKLKKAYDGKVSVILVNSEAGRKLLDMSEDMLYTEERLLDEALRYNEQLNHPMAVHSDRCAFLKNLNKGVYRALKSTKTGRMISKRRIKNALKRVILYKNIAR